MQHKNFRVCIICSRLDQPGGIERVIVNLANLLQAKGYEITLLILDAFSNSFFPIHPHIAVHTEALHFGITAKGNFLHRKIDFLRHTNRLKVKIRELNPGIVVATEYPFTIAAKLAVKKTNCKVYAWEHHHFRHLNKNRFWRALQKQFYPKVDKVVCLNIDEARHFESIGCKTAVIPNFVERNKQASLQTKTLLTIGWLSKTKGIDLVPAIAEKIFEKHPDWQWIIIGTGDEENELREELKKRNLLKNVQLIYPTKHDLTEEYRSATLYVMLSRFECFPMVLLEAMSQGVPCVAFDCPTGPRHIITDSEDGVLVAPDNSNLMVQNISELIADKERLRSLGMNAYRNITRYSEDKIFSLWVKLFAE